jgi:spectinomycin phosphotransferase
LTAISTKDTPGKQLLRQTLLPRWNEILDYLQHLKKLQARVRSLDQTMVICHTDLHGANLMLDDNDNLYILDWENALIAPPEHDMIFFAGEINFWKVFWPKYTRHFQQPSLDGDLLSFYYYRRGLEDVAGFGFRILQREGGEERDREDIDWLRGNLAGLAEIEKTVADIQAKFSV